MVPYKSICCLLLALRLLVKWVQKIKVLWRCTSSTAEEKTKLRKWYETNAHVRKWRADRKMLEADDFRDLSLFDKILMSASLALPKYEKFVNFSCGGHSYLVEPQEREHSHAHAVVNTYIRKGWPPAKQLEQLLGFWFETFGRSSLWISKTVITETKFVFPDFNEYYANFQGARPMLRDIFLWHMFEETEHGSEMCDLFCGRHTAWYDRLIHVQIGVCLHALTAGFGAAVFWCTASFERPLSRCLALLTCPLLFLWQATNDMKDNIPIAFIIACGRLPTADYLQSAVDQRKEIASKYLILESDYAAPLNVKSEAS